MIKSFLSSRHHVTMYLSSNNVKPLLGTETYARHVAVINDSSCMARQACLNRKQNRNQNYLISYPVLS